ncbi:UNVERIFIED_CONTAM: DnaJ protein [Sesamum calycinum]|uniref:DnaJ protein n=1 Tax=Sesamum calycinum TaxID=2727403 RepID=A0AAW2SE35_9LAMI
MPLHADEEAHQLSYLQKHLGNTLSLLAYSAEAEGDDSLFEVVIFVHANSADSYKAINDEGMPMYQRPFMKGKLYIHFNVDFQIL